MQQLDLSLPDTDAIARGRRRVETRLRRERLVTDAIYRRAVRIYHGEAPQDPRILCPIKGGGYWCQWVAGHYGGCVLGREGKQRTRRGL